MNKHYIIWGITTTNCTRTREYDKSPDPDFLSSFFKQTPYDSMHFSKGEIEFIQRNLKLDSTAISLLGKTSLFIESNKLISKRKVIEDLFYHSFDFIVLPPNELLKLLPEAANGVFVINDFPTHKILLNELTNLLRK
jgi:hypothetical protein